MIYITIIFGVCQLVLSALLSSSKTLGFGVSKLQIPSDFFQDDLMSPQWAGCSVTLKLVLSTICCATLQIAWPPPNLPLRRWNVEHPPRSQILLRPGSYRRWCFCFSEVPGDNGSSRKRNRSVFPPWIE